MRVAIVGVALMVSGVAGAQGAGHASHPSASRAGGDTADVMNAMAAPVAGLHMRMTATRARTAADSARAMAVADTLRRALEKYRDPAAAERDGYKLFLPNVKDQKIYHYTKYGNAFAEAFRFSAGSPTSILYVRDSASGKLMIVGGMYTMPKRTSPANLDTRIPLSVAQWHQHVNICAPPKDRPDRIAERKDGKPIFGTEGTIVTKAACDSVGGRFYPTLFGWMVHANVFSGTDLKTVWGHDEVAEHAGHGGHPPGR